MRLSNVPLIIYWIDLENDKIRINCDDDLRFFMEESKIQKLIFEFEKIEPTRKRPQSSSSSLLSIEGDNADYSKRLRTKMEQIDLTDSSSMELSDLEDVQEGVVPESISSTMKEVPLTTCMDNEPRVKIISVDVIKNADVKLLSVTEEVVAGSTEEVLQIEDDNQPQPSVVDNAKKERKRSDSNRIVISDSSDEESEDNFTNRRFSDGHYDSTYSFANANNDRASFDDSRASFDDDFRRYNHHRRRREHFNEHARSTYRNCSDNMQRIFHQANSVREEAMRNFRQSANLLPELLTTFQSRFGPVFQQQYGYRY